MKQKIRKIMNFASCGIHSNYRNTDKIEGYLDLLEEVEAYIKEAEKASYNIEYKQSCIGCTADGYLCDGCTKNPTHKDNFTLA